MTILERAHLAVLGGAALATLADLAFRARLHANLVDTVRVVGAGIVG
jgi:hypothetical protein